MNDIIETPDSTKNHNISMHPDLDRLAQYFIDAFPVMGVNEQRLALKLYALLSEGDAIELERLSESVDMPLTDVRTMLENWPGVFYDENQHIIGFWGITVQPMGHRMEIDGNTNYTWCAWDSLFIPRLIGASANVTSKCEQSGEEIKLSVSQDGATSESHKDVVVSFVTPDIEELRTNTTTSFCHLVYFFKDRQTGETWLENHEGAFLLTLDEAFVVGKKMNASRYNLTLN